jgi:hypothetical protein
MPAENGRVLLMFDVLETRFLSIMSLNNCISGQYDILAETADISVELTIKQEY